MKIKYSQRSKQKKKKKEKEKGMSTRSLSNTQHTIDYIPRPRLDRLSPELIRNKTM